MHLVLVTYNVLICLSQPPFLAITNRTNESLWPTKIPQITDTSIFSWKSLSKTNHIAWKMGIHIHTRYQKAHARVKCISRICYNVFHLYECIIQIQILRTIFSAPKDANGGFSDFARYCHAEISYHTKEFR